MSDLSFSDGCSVAEGALAVADSLCVSPTVLARRSSRPRSLRPDGSRSEGLSGSGPAVSSAVRRIIAMASTCATAVGPPAPYQPSIRCWPSAGHSRSGRLDIRPPHRAARATRALQWPRPDRTDRCSRGRTGRRAWASSEARSGQDAINIPQGSPSDSPLEGDDRSFVVPAPETFRLRTDRWRADLSRKVPLSG